MNNVAVTGANGFVGQHFLARLENTNWNPIPLVRHVNGLTNEIVTGDLQNSADLTITPIHAFVHLAARTHVLAERADDPLSAYREVNVKGTRAALRIARRAGANHFIFVSSVKAAGEETTVGLPLSEHSPDNPQDYYGITKLEAEREVQKYCRKYGMSWTIIRPPLVYGPGVKANFQKLASLVCNQIPLPFGLSHNLRSIVFVENLVDFIFFCLNNIDCRNSIFFIDDGTPLSLKQIVEAMARAQRKKIILLPVPFSIAKIVLVALGKKTLFQRLFGSLEISSAKANNLGWRAPFSSGEGFDLTFK